MRSSIRKRQVWPVLAVLLVGTAWVARAASPEPTGSVLRVSQKDQAFKPGALTIRTGATIDIVNDDDDVLHHAYVESKTFKFDSSDQEPGTTVKVTFPVGGTFTVLCGIHPRMKLRVTVQ